MCMFDMVIEEEEREIKERECIKGNDYEWGHDGNASFRRYKWLKTKMQHRTAQPQPPFPLPFAPLPYFFLFTILSFFKKKKLFIFHPYYYSL